jgi:hypothetical protein
LAPPGVRPDGPDHRNQRNCRRGGMKPPGLTCRHERPAGPWRDDGTCGMGPRREPVQPSRRAFPLLVQVLRTDGARVLRAGTGRAQSTAAGKVRRRLPLTRRPRLPGRTACGLVRGGAADMLPARAPFPGSPACGNSHAG